MGRPATLLDGDATPLLEDEEWPRMDGEWPCMDGALRGGERGAERRSLLRRTSCAEYTAALPGLTNRFDREPGPMVAGLIGSKLR